MEAGATKTGAAGAGPPRQPYRDTRQPYRTNPQSEKRKAEAIDTDGANVSFSAPDAGDTTGGGRRKKARRAPRRRKKPYSEMPWEDRRQLQVKENEREAWRAKQAAVKSAAAGARGGGRRNRRPREQPPPAPTNTSRSAASERAHTLTVPSEPHTPANGSPAVGSTSHGVSDDGDADFFSDAFENAMSTLYDDMKAWEIPALIAAIKERDDLVDSLKAELNEYHAAEPGDPSATFRELQTLRSASVEQAEKITDLERKLANSEAKVADLQRELHMGRSVLEIEKDEASAFAAAD